MYCKNCGTQIPDGANFCSKCGEKITTTTPPLTTTSSSPYPQEHVNSKPATSKKSPLAAFVIVILLAIVAILVVYLLNNRPVEVPTQPQQQIQENITTTKPETEPISSAPSVSQPVPETEVKEEKVIPIDLTRVNAIRQGEQLYVGTDSYDLWHSELYFETEEVCTDVVGNEYSSGTVHYIAHFRMYDEADENRTITYYLNQDYALLSGTLYRPYVSLHCDSPWSGDGKVEFYGDGALLYTGSIAYETYDPIDFEIDVTGVRELQILFRGTWKDSDWDSDYYMPKACLANMKVTKVSQ